MIRFFNRISHFARLGIAAFLFYFILDVMAEDPELFNNLNSFAGEEGNSKLKTKDVVNLGQWNDVCHSSNSEMEGEIKRDITDTPFLIRSNFPTKEFGINNPLGFGGGSIKSIAKAPISFSSVIASPSGVYMVRQSQEYVPEMVSEGDSWSIAVSSSSKWLAVQRNGRLELVDTQTGSVRKTWDFQIDWRWTAFFSNDDRYMVIAGLRGFGFEDLRPELISVDLETMTVLQHHELFDVFSSFLKHIDVSSDGRWTVAVTNDRETAHIVVFDNLNGTVVYEHFIQDDLFDLTIQASFTPDNKKLIWVHDRIHCIDTDSWTEIRIRPYLTYSPFAISNDSKLLVMNDGYLLNLENYQRLNSLKGFGASITPITMEFSQDDKHLLVSGYPGRRTKIFNMETLAVIRTIDLDWNAFNGWNGREFLPHFIDPEHILIYNAATGLEIQPLSGQHESIRFESSLGEVRQLAINPIVDGIVSLSASNGAPGPRLFQLWDSDGNRSGDPFHIENGFDGTIATNGKFALIPVRDDTRIKISIFNTADFSLSWDFFLDDSNIGFDLVSAISGDGLIAVMGRNTGSLKAFFRNGRQIQLSLNSDDPIRAVLFSPDNQFMVARNQAGKVAIWDTQSWELQAEFNTSNDFFPSIVFAPDSSHLITKTTGGFADYEISNNQLHVRRNSQFSSGPIDISPDGNWMATATYSDVSIKNRYNQSILRTFKLNQDSGGITAVKFAEDGMTIYAGTRNGRILAWDLRSYFPDPVLSIERVANNSAQISWRKSRLGKMILLESSDWLVWNEVPLDEDENSVTVTFDRKMNNYKLIQDTSETD